MRPDHVCCKHMHHKDSLRALAKVSLLELAEQRWQAPSFSSPSTVVSAVPPVRIGLSDLV